MKPNLRNMLLGIVIVSLPAFNLFKNSLVKGSVTPPDSAIRAWLISGTDTLYASIDQGNFELTNIKPGNYRIIMEGRPPYRNSIKDGIRVVDGQPTDVGVIEMQK